MSIPFPPLNSMLEYAQFLFITILPGSTLLMCNCYLWGWERWKEFSEIEKIILILVVGIYISLSSALIFSFLNPYYTIEKFGSSPEKMISLFSLAGLSASLFLFGIFGYKTHLKNLRNKNWKFIFKYSLKNIYLLYVFSLTLGIGLYFIDFFNFLDSLSINPTLILLLISAILFFLPDIKKRF